MISERSPARPPMAWAPVAAVAAAVAVLLAATSNGYGYHRDELYFRLLGDHPAWGYVDQPPATPLLARATAEIAGDHLWALRLPGALALAVTVVLTAMLAREFGGGRGAQLLAAAGAGGAFPLTFGHVLLTATLDLPMTAAVLLCVVKALRADPRWWLGAGALTGLALYNKHLVTLTLIAIGAGLAIVGPRRVLWSRWLWSGVALAALVGLPNLVYQIAHDWPQLTMARAIEQDKGADSRTLFLPLQLALLGFFLVPVWVAGLVRLLRDPALRTVRALAVAYPAVCVLILVTGGQPYYDLGLVLALFAAGAEPAVRWLTARRRRRWAFAGAFALNLAISAVVALPLLPVGTLGRTPIGDISQATSDQVGWPVYVGQVAGVVDTLPAAERARTAIITANYGEAGALELLGGRHDLPPIHSGQNELWFRGGPAEGTSTIIAVGYFPQRLAGDFASCAVARELDNGVAVPNEEQGLPVTVCRGPEGTWADLWPRFLHYS
ncbi:glycosyltransferase family 39 protein [Amorphoplanes nipponensis]|uniref:Glycosyltransferase RgtA/B/C/D-like domain-containing protein n=1 Tax=Actinoplanes nipponensis TaxID=135950 RepID=A0A919JBY2_9ACTN|nr:glycosyltransferase family 39 protein [Actinoplanes nipponensis]GIE47003.1 hypothetical protein Ani05nite_05370 [Actinoplanes nipponensis]